MSDSASATPPSAKASQTLHAGAGAPSEAATRLDGRNRVGIVSASLGAAAVVLLVAAQLAAQPPVPGSSTEAGANATVLLAGLTIVVAVAGIIAGHVASGISKRTAARATAGKVGLVLSYFVVLAVTFVVAAGLIMLSVWTSTPA